MAKYLVLKDDVIDNIVEWDPNYPENQGWIGQVDPPAQIGWERKQDGSFGPKTVTPALKPTIGALPFRQALRRLGKRDSFEAAMRQLGDEAWDEWVYGTEVNRNNLFITQAVTAASISQADFDEIFRY